MKTTKQILHLFASQHDKLPAAYIKLQWTCC